MGKEKAACPKCNGKNLASQLSVFAVQAKGPRVRARLLGDAAPVEIPEGLVPVPCPTWTNRSQVAEFTQSCSRTPVLCSR